MKTLSSIRGSISRQLRIQNVSCTTSPIRSLATISNSTPTPSSFSSSSSSSSSWVAPIKPNTEPAYDSALRYLEHFSNKTLEKARSLEKELHQSQNHKEKEELEAKIEKLRIAAEINHPRTRWEFENGKADLSLPVHRHLREQAWRKGGSLDKLTERITLQHVIPDLIPTITPTVDLQVFFGEGTGIGDHSTENCTGEVLAGVKVEPFKTFFQDGSPKIVATPFHPEEKRYTLMMIDLDVPNEAEEGFGTFCHWLINDISLSSTKTSPSSTELSSAVLPFIPVHPTEGSGLHRYAFLLLSQSQNFSSSQSSSIERENFDVRAYVEEKGLRAEGIHFFRSAWKKEDAKSRKLISQVWRDVRGLPEPKYGRAPRVDRLKDVFGEKESRYY